MRRPMLRALRAALLPAALAVAGGWEPVRSGAAVPPPHVKSAPYAVRASVSRGIVKLGERVTYRGRITGGGPGWVRFLPPDAGGAFTWGAPQVWVDTPRSQPERKNPLGRVRFWGTESVFVDIPLQVFALGGVTIPGLRVETDDGSGSHVGRLPTLRLVVVPVLSASDTSAALRPLRGPLSAPWWERVPWTRVALAALALGVIAAAIVWLRRRRRTPAPVLAPDVRRDPAEEALAGLAALRRLALPAHGRFAEHAFQLGRVVRRYLEATAGTPLPGDTTPEFVRHLEIARLDSADLERVAGLMRSWDRVKFARAPATAEEALAAEDAVESLVRRRSPVPSGKAA